MPDQDPPWLRRLELERATRYTIADLAERTGSKRRTIQLWAEGGVLVSTAEVHPGTGNARLFSVAELQLAALLTPLARMGIPIGVLTRFSSVIRPALSTHQFGPGRVTSGLEDGVVEIGRVLANAIYGRGRNWLLLAHSPEEIRIGVQTDEDRFAPFDPDELWQKSPPFDPCDSATVILNLEILSRLEV